MSSNASMKANEEFQFKLYKTNLTLIVYTILKNSSLIKLKLKIKKSLKYFYLYS